MSRAAKEVVNVSRLVKRVWLTVLLSMIPAISVAQSVNISQYVLTSPDPRPGTITTGPDGAVWFTETHGSNIGRITTAGVITEYALPTSDNLGITTGPDGALWFTQINSPSPTGMIGRITAAGVITEYALIGLAEPTAITNGPDGALWFAESGTNKIGRITTTGGITEYAIPSPNSVPMSIVTGGDGALWFTELGANKIGRITTTGVVSEYAIPSLGSLPWSITAGPDGALWFTESAFAVNKIGRITTSGAITEYPLTKQDATGPLGIVAGPDGALWFTETGNNLNKIGRITIAGAITEYVVPTASNSEVYGITVGPDGGLWFTEAVGNKIGRAMLSSGISSMAHLASGDGWTTTITLVNTGGGPSQATLNFFSDNGSPLQLPLTFPQGLSGAITTSTFSTTISADADLVIQSTGPASSPVSVGWAQLITTGAINGFAVFTHIGSGSPQETVVPLESRTPGSFVLSYDNTNNFVTGVALANVVAQSANVGVTVRNDSGTVLSTSSIALPALGHKSFVLSNEYPVSGNLRGTVEFVTPPSGQISVLGIRFSPTGAISSVPAVAK